MCFIISVFFKINAFYVFSKKSLEKNAQERFLQEFENTRNYFEHELVKDLVRDLRLLASNPMLNEFMMSSEFESKIAARIVERSFLQSLNYTKSYQRISFVDYTGKEKIAVERAGPVRTYRDISASKGFKQIESGAPGNISLEGPYVAKDGKILCSIGIYKTDEDIGELGGAVIIVYSFEGFLEYIAKKQMFGTNTV